MLKINDKFWVRSALPSIQLEGTPFLQQKIIDFGGASSFESALVIMLLGAADLLDQDGEVIVACRENLGVLGAPSVSRVTKVNFRSSLVANGIDHKLLDKYLQRSQAQQSYYKEILLEFSHYFWRKSLGQHTIAFLHLYRFLERISYVFPITYALNTNDFRDTFESFRGFLNGDKSGELKFFKNFVDASLDEEQLDSDVLIDLNQLLESHAQVACLLIRRNVSPEDIVGEPSVVGVTVRCRSLVTLLINLRNRFFHATSGHSANITMDQLYDPDQFFLPLNSVLANWLAIIYFRTLAAKSERYS